jgi:hypothetical protein
MGKHHQALFDRAVERAVEQKLSEMLGREQEPTDDKADATLERSSVEAYTFFIATAIYVVMNAFGITVNFWFGAALVFVIAACAVDLLWRSPATAHLRVFLKGAAAAVLILAALVAIRAGWVRTHRAEADPNIALVDLFAKKAGDLFVRYQTKAEVPKPPPGAQPVAQPQTDTREELPCENSMRFKQEPTVLYVIDPSYRQRVTIYPKTFKEPLLPYVMIRANTQVKSGQGVGVMVKEDTGDPNAAGLAVVAGRVGVITRGNNYAELWISDPQKFMKAKAVAVDLFAPKPFRVDCVQWPPLPKNEYLQLPNSK